MKWCVPLAVFAVYWPARVPGGENEADWGFAAMMHALEVVSRMAIDEQLRLLAGVSKGVGILSMLLACHMAKEKWKTEPRDRLRIAVHECGHAVALLEAEKGGVFEFRSARLTLGHPMVAGTTMNRIRRKAHVLEATHLKQLLVVALAGRAAERELLGRPTVGAASDLQAAQQIANLYVEFFGLDDRSTPDKLVMQAYAQARLLVRRRRADLAALAYELFATERVSAAKARNLLHQAKDTRPQPIAPPTLRSNVLLETLRLGVSLAWQWWFWNKFLAGILHSSANRCIPRPDRQQPTHPRVRWVPFLAPFAKLWPTSSSGVRGPPQCVYWLIH